MISKIKSRKVVALITAMLFTAVLILPVLVACNNNNDSGEATYTYNEYISQSPRSWNTHNATTDTDTYIQGYTEIGLYDFTLSEDNTTYAFVDEMATGDPVDVTSRYSGRYGIAANESGKAWEITLNPDATWENGTAITAEDYVWSMERVLSSEMKNSAAATYITGDYEIYNANNYYSYGTTESYFAINDTEYTDAQLEQFVADGTLYLSLTENVIYQPSDGSMGFSYSLSEWHDLQPSFFEDETGADCYPTLEAALTNVNEFGYAQITDSNFDTVKSCLNVLYNNMSAYIPSWYCTLSLLQNANTVFTAINDTEYSDAQLEQFVSDGTLYLSLTENVIYEAPDDPMASFSFSLSEWHDLQPSFFEDETGADCYPTLEAALTNVNEFGYAQITDSNFDTVKSCLNVLYNNMSAYIPSWYCTLSLLSYESVEKTPFDDVGIFATSNNTKFVLVFVNPLSQWDVKYLLTDNWIVYRPYYEAGYSTQGSLTVTSYGTTSGQYMGYGPYKLQSYQTDSQITFTRNENWYGYKEGATNYHPGQFQTDRIVCRIISDQNTALLEFEAGNLDSVRLNANNMEQYRFSDYLLTRSASNTWSITFNSDLEALQAIEADGQGNRRVLSLEDFRRGISLSINRTYIGQNILAGSAAAYSFINSNYYYDMENDPDSIYRNSDQAMQAIVDLYGITYGEGGRYATLEEAYRAVSGYDVAAAKEAFQAAYDEAIRTGIYTDDSAIKITIYNNAVSTQLTALGTYLQTCIDDATEGTPFEGKITVEIKAMQTGRYDAIANGEIEAIYYSFSGDYADPNGMLANFVDADVQTILECGFDPAKEEFSITCDFNGDGTIVESDDPTTNETNVTRTYVSWQQSLNAGGTYYSADMDTKLTIMSQLEYHLLSGFRTLPLVVGTDLTLRSMKVTYATNTSNIFAMYGGVRLMTYNYTDAEWANFIRDTSNLVYE